MEKMAKYKIKKGRGRPEKAFKERSIKALIKLDGGLKGFKFEKIDEKKKFLIFKRKK
jgi:hypothetical protein